jgi:predicted transposase/invertase (TIGR01784 family)
MYLDLKQVIVVFITTYDPFGWDRMIYTVQNRCVEEPDIPYNDGATTLFLYTKGTEGDPPQELVDALRYMEHTTEKNAVNGLLKEIQQMVNRVKQDGEVSLKYMRLMEDRERLLREGYQEGIEQGRALEQANTERERKRADVAEMELKKLQEKLRILEGK